MADSPQEPNAIPPAPSSAPVREVFHFSERALAVFAVLAFLSFAFEGDYFYRRSWMQQMHYPADAAVRVADRSMDLVAFAANANPVARVLLWTMGVETEQTTKDAITLLQDALTVGSGLQVSVDSRRLAFAHLAVLFGETGRTNELASLLSKTGRETLEPEVIAALERVYLNRHDQTAGFNEHLPSRVLAPGWAQDAFAGRIARLFDAPGLQQRLHDAARARREGLVTWSVGCSLLAWGCAIIGLVMTARLWRERPDEPPAALWPRTDGLCIFCLTIWSTTFLPWLLGWLPGRAFTYFLVTDGHMLMRSLVAGSLVHFILLRHVGESLVTHFRLRLPSAIDDALWFQALALFGVVALGNVVIGSVLTFINIRPDFLEGLNEQLLHGGWPSRCWLLVSMTVIGPCYEEVLYRGILHGTLRQRFGPGRAALISSALFALAHFYSLGGFLSVFWFGLAAAWLYERTGSLSACILGHGLCNLSYFLGDFLLFG